MADAPAPGSVPEASDGTAGRVRAVVRLAPLPAVPLAVALFFLGAPLPDVLLLPLVLAVLPVLAVAQAMMLREIQVDTLSAYGSTVLSMVVLAGLCAWAGGASPGWAGMGFVVLPPGAFLGWTLGLTAAGLGVLVLFRWAAPRVGAREHPFLRNLLPDTPGERTAFVGVSLSAGVGEELVFRGYAIGALAPWTGVGAAAVLSTLSFGVVHAYQGVLGFIRTAALGGLLAWGFLASGSLLPAMAAHTLLDLVAGLVLAERLLVPDPTEPAPHSSPTS